MAGLALGFFWPDASKCLVLALGCSGFRFLALRVQSALFRIQDLARGTGFRFLALRFEVLVLLLVVFLQVPSKYPSTTFWESASHEDDGALGALSPEPRTTAVSYSFGVWKSRVWRQKLEPSL